VFKIPKTMRAIVYRGVNDLQLETVPVPRIRRNELLVRVAVCGVCPTDIKKIQCGTVSPPRIFGHETAGTIVKVGAGVKQFKLGDRVALHHHVPCLDCHFCRHRAFAQCATYKQTGITAGFEAAGGGYAEYVRVMPFVLPGVIKIPAGNTFEEGAMLEPVNTVLKAVQRLALLPGDIVLVAGQGPIGLIFTRLFQLEGINVLASDLLVSRLKLAQSFGAKWVFLAQSKKESKTGMAKLGRPLSRHGLGVLDAKTIQRLTKKRGLDAAIIAVPSDDAVCQAKVWLRGGGKLMLFAHTKRGALTPFDLASVCIDEKELIGSYSSDLTIQKKVAQLIFSRELDVRKLITHRFPLADTPKAIQLAANLSEKSLKIVIEQSIPAS
jgi:L-iditol 2-dehydrogenase